MGSYLEEWQPAHNFTFSDNVLLEMLENATATVLEAATATPSPTGKRRAGGSGGSMAWWQQLAWTLLFSLMLILAIGGNAIVMWIVLAHRRMRTVTNYFLVNLSAADIFMSTFNCIFNFVYMLNSDWYFGRYYCTVNNFIANMSVAASVFTLTGISIDRYLAIVRPLQPRMSKMVALIIIGVIWMASLSISSPCILYSDIKIYKYAGKIRTVCIMIWPDGDPRASKLDYLYNIIFFLATYVLPMCAMVMCYTRMGLELWGSRTIGEMTQRQIDSIKSKRKVVRMFITIVSLFGLCWLPYHAYFIYIHHNPAFLYTWYVQHLYLGFYWLAMANAVVNPLVYYWMNARFRQYFKNVVCEWHCRCRKSLKDSSQGLETPPMFRHYNSHSHSRSGNSADGGCLGMSNQQYDVGKVACPDGCGRWLYPLENDCCKRRYNCPAMAARPLGVSWRRNGSPNNVMIKLNDFGNSQGHSHSYFHQPHQHHQHHHRLTTQSSNL